MISSHDEALSIVSSAHVVPAAYASLAARSSAPLRAMLKHAASAAARSSSGFEPGVSSNLVPNEYEPLIAPLSPLNFPVPPFRPPCQVALAVRVGMLSSS